QLTRRVRGRRGGDGLHGCPEGYGNRRAPTQDIGLACGHGCAPPAGRTTLVGSGDRCGRRVYHAEFDVSVRDVMIRSAFGADLRTGRGTPGVVGPPARESVLPPFVNLPYLWELRPYLRHVAGLLVIGS